MGWTPYLNGATMNKGRTIAQTTHGTDSHAGPPAGLVQTLPVACYSRPITMWERQPILTCYIFPCDNVLEGSQSSENKLTMVPHS